MANELRFILLGLGALLIGGLWWWERRRPGVPPEDPSLRSGGRFEPRLEAGEEPMIAGGREAAFEPTMAVVDEPIRVHDPRTVAGGDPPVVTIADLPENTEDVVLTDDEREAAHEADIPAVPPRRRVRPEGVEPVWERTGSVDIAPSSESTSAPAPQPAPEPEPEEDRAVSARQQRIIAIRLLAKPGQKIDGAELRKALASERFEFGKYSIFHRLAADMQPLFSVASLVEPGSFDPETMATVRYPGVSLFAVFPGPLAAPQAFDEMLAAARRLADRFGGVLQDDAGSSLTGQRVLALREELVHFEHLVVLSRARPAR